MEKDLHYKNGYKKCGVAPLISEKVYYRAKNITRDEESHVIKGSISQKGIILNIYGRNKKASKYMEQKLTEHKKQQTAQNYSLSFQDPVS